jgi:septin family protein
VLDICIDTVENLYNIRKRRNKKMRENWNNNKLMLNGRVSPPIVLHNDKEMFIAQNAHNFVWGKYRQEFDGIENEIETCKKAEKDSTEAEKRMRDLNIRAQAEIDELINKEIEAHRNKWKDSSCPLAERINELEEKLEELTKKLDDVESTAEEAQSIAEEALEKAEEALEANSNDDENEDT